ncbi:MAG: hypothetical protein FJW30_05060 [Acidobacteria bacterium]|nr:hypothetical protein [Acidobacteriota bacterium]
MILYHAPGAGLGHLTRALAICLPLRDAGIDARIVTNSPFAMGLAALARCPILHGSGAAVASLPASLLITDTFPLKGTGHPTVHIARRTKLLFDLSGALAVIEAEPLALAGAVRLPGPIRLPPLRIGPPPMNVQGKTLVVHSGVREELDTLCALAEPPLQVISPWNEPQYYPAENLYADARRVITGAGYNAMAGMLWYRGKHTAVPFERRYDDQHARLREFFTEPVDGTPVAVETIIDVWRTCRSARP